MRAEVTVNRRAFMIVSALAAFLGGAAANAAEAPTSWDIDRVLGKKDAPVTIYEYSALTCSHCAAFHRDVLPRIKKEWIETGKAKLVYRDFPFEKIGLLAALVAHCGGDERYFAFVETLFRAQDDWSRAQNPAQVLQNIAQLGGIPADRFKACVGDQKTIDAILARAKEGREKYAIKATPTFVIGDEKIEGSGSFETFDAALKKASK